MLKFLFKYDGRGKNNYFEYDRGKDANRKKFTRWVIKFILNTSTRHVKKNYSLFIYYNWDCKRRSLFFFSERNETRFNEELFTSSNDLKSVKYITLNASGKTENDKILRFRSSRFHIYLTNVAPTHITNKL